MGDFADDQYGGVWSSSEGGELDTWGSVSGSFGPTEPSWSNEGRDDYNNTRTDAQGPSVSNSGHQMNTILHGATAGGRVLFENIAKGHANFLGTWVKDIVIATIDGYFALRDEEAKRRESANAYNRALLAGQRQFIDDMTGHWGTFYDQGIQNSNIDGFMAYDKNGNRLTGAAAKDQYDKANKARKGENVPGFRLGGPHGAPVQ